MLQKNTLEMNEFTENECLPNLEMFRKFEEKVREKTH